METRIKAATEVLGPLVERHMDGASWIYGAQGKKLRKNLEILTEWIGDVRKAVRLDPWDSDKVIPWEEGELEHLEWAQAGKLLDALRDTLHRLQNGPLRRPEIAAATEEFVLLLRDLEAEERRLEPDWRTEERKAGLL